MRRILVVSIAFPPKSDPESLQVGRYTKYMIRNGCEIEVLTSANPTLYMESDPNLETFSQNISRTYSIKLLENRYLNFILRKLFPSLLQYPDSKWSFHKSKLPQIEKPSLIYSRSYPLSSTLLALRLKKKWGCPWFLHLSDPWALSFDGDSPATQFRTGPKKWNARKEQECFDLADRIGFTSHKTIELYASRYPNLKHKFMLTPNVFDEETINYETVTFSGQLNVVYTGGFGEKRSPLFFLDSIREFLNENPGVGEHIKFIFTGPTTRNNKLIFDEFSDIDQISHLGVISYNDMIGYQRNAHVLVNIDTDIPSPEHSVFFPSKLLEYFAANRRILNIANHHSVSYSIVEELNGDCVEFDDTRSLKATLRTYWYKFRDRDREFFAPGNYGTEYGANVNAKKLIAEIDRVVSRKGAA
jgi:glycosyltransferase involved in cell wall biosynthesis